MKKMKREFKVGDHVLLSPNSVYYSFNNSSNPRNTVGIIHNISYSTISSDHHIIVSWSNSKSNIYSCYDLELLPIIEEDGEYEK